MLIVGAQRAVPPIPPFLSLSLTRSGRGLGEIRHS